MEQNDFFDKLNKTLGEYEQESRGHKIVMIGGAVALATSVALMPVAGVPAVLAGKFFFTGGILALGLGGYGKLTERRELTETIRELQTQPDFADQLRAFRQRKNNEAPDGADNNGPIGTGYDGGSPPSGSAGMSARGENENLRQTPNNSRKHSM